MVNDDNNHNQDDTYHKIVDVKNDKNDQNDNEYDSDSENDNHNQKDDNNDIEYKNHYKYNANYIYDNDINFDDINDKDNKRTIMKNMKIIYKYINDCCYLL